MYEERDSKVKKINWKGILLKIALGVVLLALIIYLLPIDRKSNVVELSATFKSNMSAFQTATRSYFVNDRLPKNVGESNKKSLADLISIGQIKELKTEDGDLCNFEESYAKVTKSVNNYEVEVNLICGNEEARERFYIGANTTTTTTTTTKKKTTTTTRRPGSTTTTTKRTTTKQRHYSFIFNSNGGTQIAPQYIKAGSRAQMPKPPTRNGFHFVGWFHDDRPFNFNTPINSNTIIIARWVPINIQG